MKWNYIFASCFIAALLLDQASAGRFSFRSRSGSSSRFSGSSRSSSSSSSGSSRSSSPTGSQNRHRPSSTHVTHYDPANSIFSRTRSPSPGPSTSSAGSSRRPSDLPLSHSSSTSSGYVSSTSLNSPHHPSPSGSSSSPIPQYFGNQRPTSQNRASTSGHHSSSGASTSGHHSSSGASTSGHQSSSGSSTVTHQTASTIRQNSRSGSLPRSSSSTSASTSTSQNYLPRQSFDPRARYSTAQVLQTDAVAIPTNPGIGVIRRRPLTDYHTSNDLAEIPVVATAMKDFAAEHRRRVTANRDLTNNEKRLKKKAVKDIQTQMSTQNPAGTSSQHQHPGVLTALEYTPPKHQLKKIKCGRPGSTAESCYDYYGFSMFWIPTLYLESSSIRANAPRENKWVIHGLWPNKNGITIAPPRECAMSNMRFDRSRLTRMSRELHEHWYSINMENEVFWKNEWDKHGACAARSIFINDIEGYFKKTLSLKNTARFEEILNRIGFVPGSKMPLQRIQDAIAHHHGTPSITTVKDRRQADDVYYLSEIKICLNHRFKRMNCPQSQSVHPDILAQEITYNSMSSV